MQQDEILEMQLQLQQLSEELEHKTHDLQESRSSCDQLSDELILEKSRLEEVKLSLERVQNQVECLKGSTQRVFESGNQALGVLIAKTKGTGDIKF